MFSGACLLCTPSAVLHRWSRSLSDQLFLKAGSLASWETPLHLQHGDGIPSMPPQLWPPAISYHMPQECKVIPSPPRPHWHECRGPCNVQGPGGAWLTFDFLTIHQSYVRLAEHRRVVQKSYVNNGIAMHVANTSHSIDWANARVVKTVPGYRSHSDQEEPGPHESGQWTPTPPCLEPYLTEHTLIATPTLMMSLLDY